MDLLFPRKKEKKYQLYAAYGKSVSRDPKRRQENHRLQQCQPRHSPPTTVQPVSNLLRRSSYMQASAHLCKGNGNLSVRCHTASVPFVSVLSDFLVSHFYELISSSHIQERQRLRAQLEQEGEQSQIYHLNNDFVK